MEVEPDGWGEYMISRGSEWHRWEPHIHAPGTVLNNQFGAVDPWQAYLSTLEGLTPSMALSQTLR